MITANDTKHEVVKIFSNGAELHRFKNAAGVEYSAIYELSNNGDPFEVYSCERAHEADMIKYYLAQ